MVIGRLVALPEVALLGVIGLAMLLSCWAVNLVRATMPLVERQVRPRRVTQGQTVELALTVGPAGRRPVPTTQISDTVDQNPLPSHTMAPIASGSTRRLVSKVVATHRGIARVGPVTVSISDPLGLTEVRAIVNVRDEVIVWPRIEALSPTDRATASGAESAPVASLLTAPTVDDAPRLREYQPGDDVRRVHWPSTARLGTPVVREVDRPADDRTIVVLDTRRSHHDGPSFERAVIAAASVVSDRVAVGEPVRLITTSGADSGQIIDRRDLERVLDDLAAIQPQAGGNFVGVIRTLRSKAGDGVVIACAGSSLDSADLAEFHLATFGMAGRLISCGDAALAGRRIAGPGVVEVRFGSHHRLSEQWVLTAQRIDRAPA